MAVFKKAGPWLVVKARPTSFMEPFPSVVEDMAPDQADSSLSENGSYLDQGCRVSGELSFDGPVRIDGEVEGQIYSNDSVAIGEDAVVSADIKAAAIVVAGAISGELSASQYIEVYSSAKVLHGSLAAPEMAIDEGAVIEGTRITRTVREDRKPKTIRMDRDLIAKPKGKEHARRL
jgi:cytoskeletal protein CcmA (bactofilin family)